MPVVSLFKARGVRDAADKAEALKKAFANRFPVYIGDDIYFIDNDNGISRVGPSEAAEQVVGPKLTSDTVSEEDLAALLETLDVLSDALDAAADNPFAGQ